jgi:hypothetical protein
MKKKILPVILLVIICVLSACNKAEPATAPATTTAATTTTTTTTTALTTKAETTAAATTTAATTAAPETEPEAAEEDFEIFPEVTYLNYSELEIVEVIELSAYGDTNLPGMTETNEAIYEDVISRVERYEGMIAESENNTEYYIGGIDVFAYSFTDENYIQIYNTIFEYPTYGTAGDLFGFVYDIQNDDYITLDEFLAGYDIIAEDLAASLKELYTEQNPTDETDGVFIKTFNLSMGPDGEYVPTVLFEMEVTPETGDEPYKGFYLYSPIDGDIMEMNSDQLFDPYSVDQYEEPLHGQAGWQEYYAEYFDEPATGNEFEILQGDYYFEGDTATAHFTFYGTENVDAYYASGSYETSYTLELSDITEITDEDADSYNEIEFNVYDADGELVFIIKAIDAAPGAFELYDANGLRGEYINISI